MRPKCGGKSENGFIFKKINENENIKMKKKSKELNQPNLSGNGLDLLCYLQVTS